jgi:hypothetical protein
VFVAQTTMTKSQLIADLNDEYRQILELVQNFGKADFDQPGAAGDWTVKDVFGHLAFWNAEAARAITVALLSERPVGWLDVPSDEINARETATRHELPLHQVMMEFRRTHHDLVALVERTPERRLERDSDHKTPEGQSANGAWIAQDAISHYRTHRTTLQTWLTRN